MSLLLPDQELAMMNKAMNRIITALFAITALLCSCSKERYTTGSIAEPDVTTLQAWQEEGGTKATYDGRAINWDLTDALSVFPAGASSGVKFSKQSGNNNYFQTEGSIDLKGAFALYPYASSASLSNGKITAVIKTGQTATPGSFAPDANLAVAYSADGKYFFFKNAVSYIKISYKTSHPGVSLSRITFTALDGTKLSGRFILTPEIRGGEVADVTAEAVGSSGMNYVTLTGDIRPNTDYYLVVPPVSLSGGYRLDFTDSNGNKFSKAYTSDKNKARLLRNNISATGVKNLDNYTIDVQAYWRLTDADDFTGGDKYLIVKDTDASSTGYRVFDENKTNVYIGSGQQLVDKFAGGNILGLPSKLSSWKSGGSAPLFMSHYVLYSFRNAYSDDGLKFGPGAAEVIQNPADDYAFSVTQSSDASFGKMLSVKLCYKHQKEAKSMETLLTNCYLEDGGNGTFKIWGNITQSSIDDLIDVFFLGKGSQFNSAISRSDLHSGADRAVNVLSQIGFCSTEVATYDGKSLINSCFMLKNYYLCNYPDPEAILIYKKASRSVTFNDYYRLFGN